MLANNVHRRLVEALRLIALLVIISAFLSAPASAGVGWWEHSHPPTQSRIYPTVDDSQARTSLSSYLILRAVSIFYWIT